MKVRVNNDDSLTAFVESDRHGVFTTVSGYPCQMFGEGTMLEVSSVSMDLYTIRPLPVYDTPTYREADLSIKKVIFNNPATIVYWKDGSKTVVKCTEDDVWDPEKGLAMAVCKRVYGADFHKIFNKYIPEEQEDVESLYPSLPVLMDGLRKAVEKATHIIKEEK